MKFPIIAPVIFSLLLSINIKAQTDTTHNFHKGELSTAKNHTGDVWLSELSSADSVFNYGIAMATFEPGAKLGWHLRLCSDHHKPPPLPSLLFRVFNSILILNTAKTSHPPHKSTIAL